MMPETVMLIRDLMVALQREADALENLKPLPGLRPGHDERIVVPLLHALQRAIDLDESESAAHGSPA